MSCCLQHLSCMQFGAHVLNWKEALPTSLTKMVILPEWLQYRKAREGLEVSTNLFAWNVMLTAFEFRHLVCSPCSSFNTNMPQACGAWLTIGQTVLCTICRPLHSSKCLG